jgi:hypothetical protein
MHAKKWLSSLASVFSAVVLVTVMAVPAQASTDDSSDAPAPTVSTTTAPLEIDCSTITEEGREYAITHDLNVCGILSDSADGASARGTVYNTCGSASIDMSSAGSGNAMIVWSIHSTQGWILWYGIDVYYSGQTNSGVVGFSGIPVNIDAGDYTTPHTGHGWASTYLAGTVETVLWTCYVAYPDDTAFIS